jgi:hypothetical protein
MFTETKEVTIAPRFRIIATIFLVRPDLMIRAEEFSFVIAA